MMKFRGKKLWKVVVPPWQSRYYHYRSTYPYPTLNGALRKAYYLLFETKSVVGPVPVLEIWHGDFTHPEQWPLTKYLVLRRRK